jgi:hypothetical protein
MANITLWSGNSTKSKAKWPVPVPMDYAIRFSSLATALTARRVRHGVEPDIIC